MILHALETGVDGVLYVFADTGNEHQHVYDYLEYLESALQISIRRVKADFTARIAKKREYIERQWWFDGVPKHKRKTALSWMKPTGNPFLDMCIWKGRFPSTKARFCTDFLKSEPITKQVVMPLKAEGRRVRSWQGVRADESPRRKKLPMHERGDFGITIYRPILKWSATEVFDLHRKHGIKPNPLYKEGMNRVGCMPCIMCRKAELFEISRRYPKEVARLRWWERVVSEASKRGSATFFPAVHVNNGASNDLVTYKTHGIEQAVQWSMTERGGKQFDLFKAGEEIPMCASNYGLCELEDG